jgi:glycosyltransferase involved in cell wall biosynthesis
MLRCKTRARGILGRKPQGRRRARRLLAFSRAVRFVRHMARIPVSAYIRTKNEERLIGEVVRAALAAVDEVVLIDSGSTDRTIEIAEAAGARVVRETWHGWGRQKRIGEDACRHDWLFDLDADEIVTPELASEIRALFAGGEPAHRVYQLLMATAPPVGAPWMTFNLVDRRKLYDRRVIRQPDHPMDDQFRVPAGLTVGRLKGRLLHRSFTELAQLEEKFNRHSSASARDKRLKPFWQVAVRLLAAKPFYFLNQYLRRGLWRAGWYGFAVAEIAAHGRWLKDAKMMELHLKARAAKRQGTAS